MSSNRNKRGRRKGPSSSPVWLLGIVAVAALAIGLPVTSGDIQDVSPEGLNAMLKNGSRPVVVDVREPWEYARGHIPGAVLIPLGQLAARLGEIDPSRPVAVVCASGSRSQSAAALLGQKGFAKVYNVLNGMYGWQMAGFDMIRN